MEEVPSLMTLRREEPKLLILTAFMKSMQDIVKPPLSVFFQNVWCFSVNEMTRHNEETLHMSFNQK